MKGNIYVLERCPVCDSKMRHDERRNGCFCPKHEKVRAGGPFVVRFGRQITRQFPTYERAARFLTGLRYETDKGTFDHRDYKKDNPLGFETLARKWLEFKAQQVRRRSFNNLNNYMERAISEWGPENVKTIGYAEIEDFLFGQKVSDKTRSNMKSCLHDFWSWLKKRKVLRPDQIPEFPETSYELGWRNIVDIETQSAILEEVRRISYAINPKIWIGIRILATYIKIRPGELRMVRERDINLEAGYIHVEHPKEKTSAGKYAYLLDEDIEMIRSLPRGLPDMFFFRHEKGRSGIVAGDQFGPKYLKTWWDRACENLGVEGVDLYGGTKHSTATALGKHMSPEQIKRGTGHMTNKAFDRYFQPDREEALKVYQKSRQIQKEAGKVIDFEEKAKQHSNNRKKDG